MSDLFLVFFKLPCRLIREISTGDFLTNIFHLNWESVVTHTVKLFSFSFLNLKIKTRKMITQKTKNGKHDQCKTEKMIESNTFYFSNIPNLWSMTWLYMADAATVETVTPVISQSWIGETVKLTCKADGAPTPILSWKNPSGKVIKQLIDFKTTVDVSMSSDQDFGNYTCEATNDVNTDTRTVLVQQISKWNICCSLVVHKYLWYTSSIRGILSRVHHIVVTKLIYAGHIGRWECF